MGKLLSNGDNSTRSDSDVFDAPSEGFDDDSQASYMYRSGDEEENSSSVCTEDEKDYFGDACAIPESDSSEVAWEDSDENEMLREDMQSDAAWLTAEGLTKTLKRKTTKISFKLSKKLFTANSRIKLFKVFGPLMIAVDTFNVIYLMTDFDNFKAYKIDFFRITDVVFFNDRLLFSGSNAAVIKELLLDGQSRDINKHTGRIKRMVSRDSLYVAADKLFRFDKNFNLKDVFNQDFKDVCVNRAAVVALKSNGDIFVFDHRLSLKKKCAFPEKFRFRRIFCTEDNYYIATEKGFCVLDHHFELVREFTNMRSTATALGFNSNFTFYGGDAPNSLRIIKHGLVSYDKFPYSKVRIDPIATLDVVGDTLYFAHSKFISKLTFNLA